MLTVALASAAGGLRPAYAQATAQATAPALGAGGTIRGVVYDSLAARPLGGVLVQAVPRNGVTAARTTTADSAGRFRLDSLAPGAYLVGFYAPLLDALEVELSPRPVELGAGDAVTVALAVPGIATIRPAVCGAVPLPAGAARDSVGLLVGVVRATGSETAVPGARVVVTWSEYVVDAKGLRREQRRVPVTPRASGSYAVCDLPVDAELAASAESPGRSTGVVELAFGPTRFLQRDFALGDSAADAPAAAAVATAPGGGARAARAGTARLAGVVRGASRRPLGGALVRVWGTEAQAVADADGRFALDGLPSGTQTVEVRAVGYAPNRTPVDLARGKVASVELAMERPAPVLDRVTVVGKRSRAAQWQDDFLKRRRAGFGRFFTAADIDQDRPLYTSDMLRRAAGVRVVPARGTGYAVRLRGGCTPVVVLDGLPLYGGADDLDAIVAPQDLSGIEVYTGLGGVPVQYAGTAANGCGAVLLWTKR